MIFLGIAAGLLLGALVTLLYFRMRYGNYKAILYVDHSNKSKDLYKLDAGDIESLAKKKKAYYIINVIETDLQKDFNIAK